MSQETTKSAIPPNRSFQRTNISSFTESRRQRFLSFRKQNRALYFEKARKIVLNLDTIGDNNDNNANINDFSFNQIHFHKDSESNEVSTNKYQQYPPPQTNNNNSPKSNRKNKKKKKRKSKYSNAAQESRRKYVDMFMVHEWMIDIPDDLTQNWLVGLRAEGERCLVFSTGGGTISRNRSGNFIHNRFPSSLPSGNYVQQKKASVTILDCIWIKNISTYYVIDCILWNDQHIGSSDACMRLWFIQSKLSECNQIAVISKYNKYRFVSIQTMSVNAENLHYLYSGGSLLNNQNANKEEKKEKVDNKWYRVQPDGLIFYHKNGSYVNALSCPLILIWKDSKISRWFVDTSNRQNKNKLLQFVTLQLQRNGTITTHESDIVLGVMSTEELEIKKYNFKPNQLLRYSITNAIMDECVVDNLCYVKRASVSKMTADTWSKIVFQHQAKNGLSIQFEDIVNVGINTEKKANNDGVDGNECDNDMQNIDDELRVATLGLSNVHL